jgi:hypothetical protein
MATQLGVEFDNTALQSIVLADHDGVPRTFEIRSILVPTGHEMLAQEVPDRAPAATRTRMATSATTLGSARCSITAGTSWSTACSRGTRVASMATGW